MAFDPFAEEPASSGPFDPFAETKAPQRTRQNQSLIADIGTGLKRGVEQIPGMVTGLADIAAAPVSAATGITRPFSRGADWLGEKTGFQPAKWAEEAGQEYSPEMQQSLRNVEEAKGFFPTIGAIAENPRVAANLVAESLPSTIAGGLLAKGAMGAVAGAEKLAAMKAAGDTAGLLKAGAIAGGIGEGAVTAGQQMAQTDYGVDPLKAAGTALAAGAITGAIGAGSGRLANSAIGKKLGLSDLETSIAAGTLGQNAGKAGALGYAKRVGAGIAQEGLLEEAPQSYSEQVWQNLANSKPWNEGAAEAAAQGAVAGGIMGGGVNAIPRASRQEPESVPPPPNPNVVEVPTITGEAVPVDKTSGPLSAAVHAGANSGAIPTVAPVDAATSDPFERLATLELLAEQRPLTPQEITEANTLSAQLSASDAESVAPDQSVVDTGAGQSTDTGIPVSQVYPDPVMAEKTDKQLANLSKPGHTNATRQAATAEIERRVAAPAQQTTTTPLVQKATQFNVPAMQAPNIAPQATIAPDAAQNIPTNPVANVQGSNQQELGGVYRDWIAKHDHRITAYPSSEQMASYEREANNILAGKGQLTSKDDFERFMRLRSYGNANGFDLSATYQAFDNGQDVNPSGVLKIKGGVNSAPQQEQPKPLPESSNQAVTPKRKAGPQNRNDLVGAILRVTGGNGIAANMAQTITGDKAGSGNAKLRGLFTNAGTMDLGDVAELLRVQEGFDVRDGDHLSELIRNAAAGDTAVSMSRMEDDAAAKSEAERKDYYVKRAEELGLKKVGGKRTLDMVVADVEREEARLIELEANAEREAIQVADAVDSAIEADMTEADFMRWLSDDIANTYTDEEIQRAEQDQADREDARVEANAIADAEERAQSGSQQGNGNQPAAPQGGRVEAGTGAVEDFNLAAQTPAELAAIAAKQKADAAEEKRLHDLEVARVKREANAKETARRKAQVLAEREAAKKAEVDALAKEFDLGQAAPAPVERRVDTEAARGQQDVFAQKKDSEGESSVQGNGDYVVKKDDDGSWNIYEEGYDFPLGRDGGYASAKEANENISTVAKEIADFDANETASVDNYKIDRKDGETFVQAINKGTHPEDAVNPDVANLVEELNAHGIATIISGKTHTTSQSVGAWISRKYLDAASNAIPKNGWRVIDDGRKTIIVEKINGPVTSKEAKSVAEKIAQAAKPASEPKQERGEVGASLTKEQRKSVLKTLVDVYRQNKAPREMKGVDSNGNERFGYAYSPEYFVKSDITGAMVRYYVTLPDGKVAHPTELFADYTQSDIDKAMQKEIDAERERERNDKSERERLLRLSAPTINEANGKFNHAQRFAEDRDSIVPALLTNGELYLRSRPENADKSAKLLGEGWRVEAQPASQKEEAKPAFDYDKAYQDRLSYLEKRANNFGLAKIRAEAQDGLAGIVIARDFGESVEDFFKRRPDNKARYDATKAWLDGEKPAADSIETLRANLDSAEIAFADKPSPENADLLAIAKKALKSRGEPAAVDAKKEAKLPWQMTREEYLYHQENIYNESGYVPLQTPPNRREPSFPSAYWASAHKDRVEEALSEGKDVPAEVLADYPDLQKKEAKSDDRDHFTLERLNRDTDKMEPVTFERGEYVRYNLSGKDVFGDIDGISHARREFSVNGLWYPFGFAYKAERPAEPVRTDTVSLSSVIDKANAKYGEGLTEADRVPRQYKTIADIDSAIEGAYEGTLSVNDYKAAFRGFVDNKETIASELNKLTKDQLYRRVGKKIYGGSETKPEVVSRALDAIQETFALRRSYGSNSYTMGPGMYEKYKADKLAALTQLVESSTAEDIKEFADEIAKQRGARQEKIEASKDPKTIEDFDNAIRLKKVEGMSFADARMSLTPEQRAEYDRLKGAKSRDERKARADQQKTDVRVAAQTTDGQVVETKHTKTGEPLFVVKAAERVERDVYSLWNATAKRMGGHYSSFRGNGAVPGFQFKTRENADAFLAFIGGNAEAAKEVVQERRDAFADDKSQSAVERLNEMADRMEERADESLGRERKANTERRARFATSAESAANAEKAMAKTMRRIAEAIGSGTAQFLDRVRQKAQIEYLASALRAAKYKEVQVTHPGDWDRNQRYNEPATAETADYAEFPQYAMMRSDLANMARKLVTLPNMKMLGQRILKAADDTSGAYNKFAKENLLAVSRFGKADGSGFATFSTVKDAERSIEVSNLGAVAVPLQIKRGEYRIVLSPSAAINRGIWQGDDRKITLSQDVGAEIVEKLGKLNRKTGNNRGIDAPPQAPWQFENAYNNLKRLAGMGIEQPWEFRAALREFSGMKEAPKERDQIKEMERAMIGRKNDGLDFFPTPENTAQSMIDAAEITEGMAVLEPSAGMGHVAEKIREAGVDPDVIELSSDRRELLKAKGFNVVGNDFIEMTPRGFTFGDVFKDKDGTLGVMRGAGGLGSGRVGFVPEGKDERQSEWRDREELTGVEKRAGNSGYDRIIMNPPFSGRRDAEHVMHAYSLLKPGGRIVSIMGEGVFFGQDKKAQDFREWLESVGGTSEKLGNGTFLDPSLPVNTGVNARMVVIDKPGSARYSKGDNPQSAPMPQPEAEANIKRILGDKLGKVLIDSGIVTFVQKASDLKNLPGAKFMTAWHGSPHDHDKFDSSKIGTGEGAQSYGYGLYFAGSKGVAEHYRKGLSQKDFIRKAREAYSEYDDPDSAADALIEDGDLSDAQKELVAALREDDWLGFDYPHQAVQAAFREPENFDLSDRTKAAIAAQGRLYQVELAPSEDEYLDWDKPLSEQSEKVKTALSSAKIRNRSGQDMLPMDPTGEAIVVALGKDVGASEYLHSIGIRGIRYLDGSSRRAGEGNHNYVIFSDDDVSITAKYAKQNSGIVGATFPDGSIALVLENLNANNFDGVMAHEGMHSTLKEYVGQETYTKLMKQLDTTLKMGKGAQWVKDADAAIPPDTAAQNRTEEIGAYAIEQYLNGAKQPNVLQRWAESFLSALRTAIIKRLPNGRLKSWAIANLMPQDLANLAISGLKAKARGQLQAQGREAMAYSQSLPTTINVDGIDRPTTNSNGKAIHPTEEGIRNFWKWFGDSKVVDAQGRPLVVYHSTLEDRSQFDKHGRFMGYTGVSGISVTDNADMASRYLERFGNKRYDGIDFEKNIMPVYVRSKNPLYRDAPFATNLRLGAPLPTGYISQVEKMGYDALIRNDAISRKGPVKHSGAKNAISGREIVVFDPMQIKSAVGNNGQFDPNNPDIRYSVASTVANQSQKAKSLFASLTSPESINTLIYNFQNKFIDLKNLQERITKLGGTLNDLNDAVLGEKTYHSKVMKKNKDFLSQEIKPLFQQMLNNKVDKEYLEQFLHARHAPEANKVLAERNPNQRMIVAGQQKAAADLKALQVQLSAAQANGSATKSIESAIEKAKAELSRWNGAQAFNGTEAERNSLSGMSDQDAAQFMASIPAGRLSTMNSLANKVDAIQAKTLDYLEQYGLMDKASLDAWRNEYQYYVPLHRDEAHPDSTSHPVGQGFSVKGDASKRRVGSNEKVTNMLGHIAMQREAAITRGEKNSVSKRLYLLAAQNPDKSFWQTDKPPMRKDVDPRTGFVRSMVDPTYKNKPNVLMVRIAGKDAAIVFNEHNQEAVRLAEALKNLDGQELDVVERTIGSATRWISSVNTQYNPIFGFINFMRDIQTGMLNLTSTALKGKKLEVFKEASRLFKEAAKSGFRLDSMNAADKALWEDFQNSGGATGYRDLFANPEDRAKALDKELKALGRGEMSKRFHAVANWLSDYNESMENVVRMAAYKIGLQNGMTKERAAALAKDLTVNFNQKGAKAAKLGAFYAFFNASMQGTARLAQTIKGPAGKKILMGGIALGVLQQVLGAMMMGGGDDDEWEKIPDFVKERSLIFPLGSDKYLAIPMPLGFNVLPNIGRLFAEWAMGGKDKPTGKQLGKLMNSVVGAFNPLGGSDVVDTLSPTVTDPVVSLLRNKDWTGKPIYREDMASLDPTPGFARTKDTATPWAKGMSYVINMATGGTDYQPGALSPTPDQIDYVIGQLTGGVGREAGKLAQTVAAPFTGDELPVHKIPLAGRLVGSTAGVSGQSARFYENIRTLNGVEREIKGLAKNNGDVDGYLSNEPLTELVGLANHAESQVKKLREYQRTLKKQGETETAKEVDVMITGVMKNLNTEMRQVQR